MNQRENETTHPRMNIPRFQLDNNFLIDLGLAGLGAREKNDVLKRFYEVLEARTGLRIASLMSDRKLDQIDALIPYEGNPQGGNEGRALEWLALNMPEYRIVVQQEFEYMTDFIRLRIAASTATSDPDSGASGKAGDEQAADLKAD